ncbi:MAG: sulfotransferase [Candidatus Rokubacteria bacterium]|nr:sulfotransferase [Candidatus Rokubacteria bacterium]
MLAEYVEWVRAARGDRFVPDPARLAEVNAVHDDPIIVCGFMKSGTTLLVDLLDSHPELIVLPDDSHMRDPGKNAERRRALDAYWVPHMVNSRGQAPFWFFGPADAPYVEFANCLEYARRALPDDERGRFLAYVAAIHCANPRRASRPRAWVEKTPENEFHVDEILRWFPRARFIHVVRHPLENFAAVKRLYSNRAAWRRGKPWSTPDPRRLAASVAAAERNRRRLGPERYHVIRYEDLAQTEHQMREVAQFLGISWDDALLSPTMNGMPTQANSTDPSRLGVRGCVTIEPVGKWWANLTWPERLIATFLWRAVLRWKAV